MLGSVDNNNNNNQRTLPAPFIQTQRMEDERRTTLSLHFVILLAGLWPDITTGHQRAVFLEIKSALFIVISQDNYIPRRHYVSTADLSTLDRYQ